MTVKQLIEALSVLNPETRVMVHGYEGGFEDIDDQMRHIRLLLDQNTEWYYGPHEEVDGEPVEGEVTVLVIEKK